MYSKCTGADAAASRAAATIGGSLGTVVERSLRQQQCEADGFSEQVGAPGLATTSAAGASWQDGTGALATGLAASRAAVHSAKHGVRLESSKTSDSVATTMSNLRRL